MKFCTAAEMRRLDEKAILECGLPGVVLMENAGRGAAALVRRHFGDLAGKRVTVVAGRGNNGGDGYVMGRIFHGWGARVLIYILGLREQIKGDARINLDVVLKMGLEVVEIKDETRLDLLNLDGSDLIIDAVLGTGLTSEVRGLYREAIGRINDSGIRVVAVDVPSGVDSDTGRIMGLAVKADLTVTFGLPKAGLLLPPGEELAGKLEVVDIGLPPHVLAEADPRKELLLEQDLRLLKPRHRSGHKGHYGHVLIVAGSTGKTGAAAMCAEAAARTGAGLVTLAVPASLNPILEEKVTEAMTEPLPEELPGFLGPKALDRLLALAEGKSVLALGPGLGQTEGVIFVVRSLVEKCELPLVIDADGLNALAGRPELLKKVRRQAALTPHPGEMSRLSGQSTAEIVADRLGSAGSFAQAFGLVLVLKGYRTVVAAPDGRIFLNTTGGPYMASGGMGDVLTGLIAGLVSQGLNLLDASRLGVFVHGLAADETAAETGPFGLLASDLLPRLPALWARFILARGE
ncbi:MAG: NAD(P)H-hydrate dehydratase [Pseudomonadota bacterium]